MRMGRTFAAAGLAALGLSFAAAAQEAQPGPGAEARRRGRQDQRGERFADYLGLDARQKAAVQKLREQQREEMKPMWDEGRALRRRLHEATEAEKPDALAVGEATLAVKAHHEKMRAQRVAFGQKIAALLTAEQKQKYEALEAARELGRGSRGPGRRGRPAGSRDRL